MKQLGILMLTLNILISGPNVKAQNKVLTFEEAVKIALENAVLLNTQRNNLEYSQMQKIASIAATGPSVSLNSTATRIDGNSFNKNEGVVVNGILDNVSASLNANINIFSGFNRINSIRQYAYQLSAQSYFVDRTAQDIMNTVSNQYLNVMLDVELVKIAKENFDAQEKQLQQVNEMVNLGARSSVDGYNQDALTKGAELKYVQAEITLDNDKALLAQTLLVDPVQEFDVERPSWDVNEIGNEVLNIEQLADNAKRYRADYLRAVKNEQAQRFGMLAWKGLMAPQLYAFGNYGTAYNDQHGLAKTDPDYPRPFINQFKSDNVYKSYGFQLSVPIFNGFFNRVNYVQQKVIYENSQVTRRNVEFQIRNDVVRAVKNFEGAKKAFVVTVDQLKAAETALGFEKERFNLGITNFVDFTNANRVFVQAETDKAQAEYKLVFQKILLDYAVGTLKPEDIEK
jgi:outer membrane protein